MNFNLFKSEPKLAFPRCEHRSPSGRQCSQPVCSTDPRFCGTHKPAPEQITTAELTEAAGTLSSPDEVHRFLKAVLLNRVRGRITPKEASVYSYLCQNLLRSLREIDHFHELHSERAERNRPSTWNVPTGLRPDELWHLPRPDRSDPPEPTPAEPIIVVNSAATDLGNVGAALGRPPLPAESATPTTSPTNSPASASSTSSTASNPPISSSKPTISVIPPTPAPPFDPRHFYPLDPTLRIGPQNPDRSIPPPDEAECRRLATRRGLPFKRTPHAYPGAPR